MTDPTATDQLMQRHAELQASAARAATADASASTTSVTSGAAVDLHVRPPPVTFSVAPQWGAWPPGPVWLCAPCRTDDLGGVAAGLRGTA
jgi:hypothetical protein